MKQLWTALFVGALMLTTSMSALALDRHVIITNGTSEIMERFQASNVGTSDWEEDILGWSVLMPGQSVNIDFDDGTGYCLYDFRITFANGSVATVGRKNVCELSGWTIFDQ